MIKLELKSKSHNRLGFFNLNLQFHKALRIEGMLSCRPTTKSINSFVSLVKDSKGLHWLGKEQLASPKFNPVFIHPKHPTHKLQNKPLAATSSFPVQSCIVYFRSRGALGSIWRYRTEIHPSMSNDLPLNAPSQYKFYQNQYHTLPWKKAKKLQQIVVSKREKKKASSISTLNHLCDPRKWIYLECIIGIFYSSFRDVSNSQLMISQPQLC